MRSRGSSIQMIIPAINSGPPGSNYTDMPGGRGVLNGSGFLVCFAPMSGTMSGAPLYDLFWRWLIDGIAPGTNDYHTVMQQSNTNISGMIRPAPVSATMPVGPGSHSVALQWRTDAPGAAASSIFCFANAYIL